MKLEATSRQVSWNELFTSYLLSDARSKLAPLYNSPRFRTYRAIPLFDMTLSCIQVLVNRKQRRVLRFLEQAELKAADRGERWEADDLRLAEQIVTLCDQNCADPYTKAFTSLFAIHPSKVVGWWHDSSKLVQIAIASNCPTPLLVRDPIQYLDSADSSCVLPPTKPALSATTVGSAGRKKAL